VKTIRTEHWLPKGVTRKRKRKPTREQAMSLYELDEHFEQRTLNTQNRTKTRMEYHAQKPREKSRVQNNTEKLCKVLKNIWIDTINNRHSKLLMSTYNNTHTRTTRNSEPKRTNEVKKILQLMKSNPFEQLPYLNYAGLRVNNMIKFRLHSISDIYETIPEEKKINIRFQVLDFTCRLCHPTELNHLETLIHFIFECQHKKLQRLRRNWINKISQINKYESNRLKTLLKSRNNIEKLVYALNGGRTEPKNIVEASECLRIGINIKINKKNDITSETRRK